MNKRYILLKDSVGYMSVVPAGLIFEQTGHNERTYFAKESGYTFDKQAVENNPEWFQEIKEEPDKADNHDIYRVAISKNGGKEAFFFTTSPPDRIFDKELYNAPIFSNNEEFTSLKESVDKQLAINNKPS